MRKLLYFMPVFLFACPSPDWRTAHTHCPCVDGWQCVDGWCVAGKDAAGPDDTDTVLDTDTDSVKDIVDVAKDTDADTDLAPDAGMFTDIDTARGSDTVTDTDTATDAETECLPVCANKECGDDGCGGTCGQCSEHQACESGKCVVQPWCGDGTCNADENCGTCPADCACKAGQTCFNNACCTPKACTDLGWECGTGNNGCGGTVDCGGCKGEKICNKGRCVATPAGFVRISSGCFDMGSPATESGRFNNEGPVHHVCISRSFMMSGTEVTQGQWKALMGNNPSAFASCGDDCPVESVSWWDAIAYANALSKKEGLEKCYTLTGCSGTPGKDYACSKVVFKGLGCKGYRLPTEAEREYAARAGTTTATYNGDLDASHLGCEEPNSVLDSIAWFCGNSGNNTHVVGKKAPNAWGLYDMSGNVWEWCWDRYKGDYYKESPSTDPLGPDTGSPRVLRGGGWSIFAQDCRSALRSYAAPGLRHYSLGFRLVRSL